jgi:glycosyltransferase involved in cell wall biosynthesis
VLIASELLSNKIGIPVRIIPRRTKHKEILALHGKARISIGISISDAISTSLLEAIIMGSFPIQTWTSCANEWIIDGKTGILVPPELPEAIAKAIRLALTDDELVNNAAKENYFLTDKQLDQNFIKKESIRLYQTVYNRLRKEKE